MNQNQPTPCQPGYKRKFRCYPISHCEDKTEYKREEINRGGRILMPPSELEVLLDENVPNPSGKMFRVESGGKCMHCGVFEFTAPRGSVIFPQWMMDNLNLKNG